jgi:hypothetical protein
MNVVRDHLKLVEEMQPFRLDLSLVHLDIYLLKGVNSISPEFKNAVMANQEQDVGDFYGKIGM